MNDSRLLLFFLRAALWPPNKTLESRRVVQSVRLLGGIGFFLCPRLGVVVVIATSILMGTSTTSPSLPSSSLLPRCLLPLLLAAAAACLVVPRLDAVVATSQRQVRYRLAEAAQRQVHGQEGEPRVPLPGGFHAAFRAHHAQVQDQLEPRAYPLCTCCVASRGEVDSCC
jgi:hypothetical protein